MKELIGFNSFPNDFVNFSLRAKLAKKYGFFDKTTMWAGVRLHRFYPPLSTLLVGLFGITGTVILYFIFTFLVWSYFQGPLVALLFLFGLYHLPQMLRVGRLSESLGYSFLACAFFNTNPLICGLFLGLAGLCYQVPFFVGVFIFLFRFNPLIYILAFLICGWWYIPFVFQSRNLSFLQEKRVDKIFGLYFGQWASMLNFFLFIWSNLWFKVFLGVGLWFLPVTFAYMVIPYKLVTRNYFNVLKSRLKYFFYLRPFFNCDLPKILPGLDVITEKVIAIEQPAINPGVLKNEDRFSGSLKSWVWACANYLIDKGIIVFNGLPSTEVPVSQTKIPENIKVYSIEELGLKITK